MAEDAARRMVLYCKGRIVLGCGNVAFAHLRTGQRAGGGAEDLPPTIPARTTPSPPSDAAAEGERLGTSLETGGGRAPQVGPGNGTARHVRAQVGGLGKIDEHDDDGSAGIIISPSEGDSRIVLEMSVPMAMHSTPGREEGDETNLSAKRGC